MSRIAAAVLLSLSFLLDASQAYSGSFCVWNGLQSSISPERGFGIVIKDGRIFSKNGDPVVAAFDLDETFIRRVVTTEEARQLRRLPGHQVVTVSVDGVKTHYEVLPGILEALDRLEQRGIKIMFFSAGDRTRNQALLKAIRLPSSGEPLFNHVGGRLISPSEIRFNFDPLSTRADILKPLKPLAREAAGGDLRRVHADMHNAFVVDDLQRTSMNQIWIPRPEAGGPPLDWAFRGEYIVGVFEEAVKVALKNPGMSLGAALKKVQTVNLLDRTQWANNRLIAIGRAMLRQGL